MYRVQNTKHKGRFTHPQQLGLVSRMVSNHFGYEIRTARLILEYLRSKGVNGVILEY